jgi:acetyltransferase-like isoleucine patch superfamily enzyme
LSLDKEYFSGLLEAYKSQEKRSFLSCGEKTVFYPESRVINLAGDRTLIEIGKNTHVRGELLIFKSSGSLQIGHDAFIGEGSKIWSADRVEIGNHVLISHNVFISDTSAHELDHLERSKGFLDIVTSGHSNEKGKISTAPIVIADYAWINPNAVILRGVKIGKGAIVGAGSIVTKDVPPFTLVAGNPAKVVKQNLRGT